MIHMVKIKILWEFSGKEAKTTEHLMSWDDARSKKRFCNNAKTILKRFTEEEQRAFKKLWITVDKKESSFQPRWITECRGKVLL